MFNVTHFIPLQFHVCAMVFLQRIKGGRSLKNLNISGKQNLKSNKSQFPKLLFYLDKVVLGLEQNFLFENSPGVLQQKKEGYRGVLIKDYYSAREKG